MGLIDWLIGSKPKDNRPPSRPKPPKVPKQPRPGKPKT